MLSPGQRQPEPGLDHPLLRGEAVDQHALAGRHPARGEAPLDGRRGGLGATPRRRRKGDPALARQRPRGDAPGPGEAMVGRADWQQGLVVKRGGQEVRMGIDAVPEAERGVAAPDERAHLRAERRPQAEIDGRVRIAKAPQRGGQRGARQGAD
jgi:hypothetical protein